MSVSSRYDNLIKKFVKEANKRPVKVDGQEVKIPWNLIKAMMLQESAGQTGAVSPVGALGLMQVMPDTARGLGVDPDKLSDPKVAIKTGVKYFKQLLKQFDGDFDLAISAYNAGPGNVRRGIAKYGREFALKYTHANNFATHEKGHKDEGQSQTQAYNRRIRQYYRNLTGTDLPGDTYYNAVQSLGLKYDKYATGRDAALDTLDRMTSSEMITALGTGELAQQDARLAADAANTQGNKELAKRIKDALAYEPSRPKAGTEGQVIERDALLTDVGTRGRSKVGLTDVIANPNQMRSEEEQLQQLAAIERYVDSLTQPPPTMVATRPTGTVEFGEPVIRRAPEPAPVMAAAPPAVALTSPVGLAQTAQQVAPPPEPPPALVVPQIPAAPPAPAPQPVQLPYSWQDVVSSQQPRTAPAVRTPEPQPMAKKKKVSPVMAAVDSARANAKALQDTVVTPPGPAPLMASQEEIQKRARGSLADQLYRQEYNLNLPGQPLRGEEEFLRNAALAQMMDAQNRGPVGFAEAFGGGLVGRDIVRERQVQNQEALQKYRQTVGLGKGGKSRRQLRFEAVAGMERGEARAQEAFTNNLRSEMAEYNYKATSALESQKAAAAGRAKQVDVDLAQAQLLDNVYERNLKRQQLGVQRRGQDISVLLKTLTEGMGAKEAKKVRAAFTTGDGKEAPYIKRLYDQLSENNKQQVQLTRDLNPAMWQEARKSGAEAMRDFNAKMNQYIRMTSGSLKMAAQLGALGLANPLASREQAAGFLSGVVKAKVLEDALAGKLGKGTVIKDTDLASPVKFKEMVGREFFGQAKSNVQAMLLYISMLVKNDQRLAGNTAPLKSSLEFAEQIGGSDGMALKQMLLEEAQRRGFAYNTQTQTFEQRPSEADTVGTIQRRSIADTIINKYGLGLTRSKIMQLQRAQQNLGQ